jgi:soluble lytic murein transglycosylase
MKKTIQFIIVTVIAIGLFLGFYYFYPHVWGEVLYPLNYQDSIKKYSLQNDLDPNLVCAVIYTESRFNADSVSGAGARGLMQVMPGTAKGISQRLGESSVGNLLDPDTSIRYGTSYLRSQLDQYNNDLDEVLASYNAGGGRANAWRMYGEALPRATVYYIANVKKVKNMYDEVYGKWWAVPEVQKPSPFYQGIDNFQNFVNTTILGKS